MKELARKRWWQQSPVLGALLIVVTLLAYFPAWNGEAVFDDDDHLTPPELSSLGGLARIWTEVGAVSQYYPVTHSVFWLEQRLWGHEMLGYHLVNILLHAGAALLFAAVLKRLSLPGAWLAGAIFALHPVHAESVAWISELKNTLSTVFYLGAALAYLHFDQTRRRGHYIIALLLFAAALLSKTVTASLPAALLVIFWWKRGHLSRRTDVQPLLPFLALGISAGLLTAWVERTFIGAQGEAFALAPVERVLIAGRAFWFYLGKLIWPAELIFIYPRWEISAGTWWQYLFPAAGLALLIGLWMYRRHMRGPLATVLFFAGTLFPVLGFLNVYPFIYSFVADHYQYLASLGIIAALSAAISVTLSRLQLPVKNVAAFLCVALLATLASLTWRQSRLYTDTETLWQATLARNPACFVAHSNLGNLYLQQGRVDDSIRHTQKALELRPGFAEIHNNLGNALLEKGRMDDALEQFRTAAELRPTLAVAHYNIATVAFRQGRFDEAETHFRKAVELRPDYVKAQNNLGSILLDQGRMDEAAIHIRQALSVHPDDVDALTNLGNIYLRQGQIDDAITQYQNVLSRSPDHANALTNLGSVFLAQGQIDPAISSLEKAVRAQPDLAQTRYLLGNAFLQKGEPEKAITHLKKAASLQPDFFEALNNLGIACLQTGNAREAITHFQASLKIHPDDPDTLANLAWVLSTWPEPAVRNAAQAVMFAQQANKNSHGQNPLILRSLAAAYAESGRFNEAISVAQQSLQLASAQGNEALAGNLHSHLALYTTASPVREPAQPSAPAHPKSD